MVTESQKSENLPKTAMASLMQGNKIEAIKILREARGIDLKEAKDALDEYVVSRPELRQKFKAANERAKLRLFRVTAAIGLAAAAAYYWLIASN